MTDYAIGVEPNSMFFTVADASANGFKFYGNATNCTTISGTGDINDICEFINNRKCNHWR